MNARVRLLLVLHFNESELRDLCFDLGVDYENLPGQAKSDKARELLGYARRHARWEELMRHCTRLRPRVEWTPKPASTSHGYQPTAAPPPSSDLAASLEQLGTLLSMPQPSPPPSASPLKGEPDIADTPPEPPVAGGKIGAKFPALDLSKAEHIIGLSMATGSATTGASLGKHLSELLKHARNTPREHPAADDQHETSIGTAAHKGEHELAPDIDHDDADDDDDVYD